MWGSVHRHLHAVPDNNSWQEVLGGTRGGLAATSDSGLLAAVSVATSQSIGQAGLPENARVFAPSCRSMLKKRGT